MGIERRCLKCGTWNNDEDYCKSCNAPLSPKVIEEIKEAKKEEIRRNTPPTKLDIFLDKWKNNRFFTVRATYYVCYSIWTVFMAIGGFFTWISATTVG